MKKYIGPLGVFLLLTYFAYHSITGDRGLVAWISLNEQLTNAKTRLSELEKLKTDKEDLVKRLRPESLDSDLLERQARSVLGYASPLDIILRVNP